MEAYKFVIFEKDGIFTIEKVKIERPIYEKIALFDTKEEAETFLLWYQPKK